MKLDITTLIVTYISTILAFIIIVIRLMCRYIRGESLQPDDKWMAAAAVPLLIRLVLVHFILVFGTNKIGNVEGFSQRDIEKLVIGSKLILACRVSSASL